jgi:peroxiredoxin (alkyl hydroperoxide reductase subunit C)
MDPKIGVKGLEIRVTDHQRASSISSDSMGIDSHDSHSAWERNIKEKFGVETPSPIIDDLSMQAAKACGMIHPGASDASAVRATFIIDPEGILRAMVCSTTSNGRSIDAFVRLVKALQTSDELRAATPEAWQPGDTVIAPPPATAEASGARMAEGCECSDWCFRRKELTR